MIHDYCPKCGRPLTDRDGRGHLFCEKCRTAYVRSVVASIDTGGLVLVSWPRWHFDDVLPFDAEVTP